MEALHELISVLCNPEGKVCISGSPADLEIIQKSLDALRADLAKAQGEAFALSAMHCDLARAGDGGYITCALHAENARLVGEVATADRTEIKLVQRLNAAEARVGEVRDKNAAQAKQIKRLREALTTIADSDMPVCNSCEGEGNRYADGKAHYYSEHAPTIPCPECCGVGRIPDLTANDMRELAEEALKEASHD